MIAAVFVDNISSQVRTAKHQKCRIPAFLNVMNGNSRVPPDWRHKKASRRCGLALTKKANDRIYLYQCPVYIDSHSEGLGSLLLEYEPRLHG